MIPAYAGTETSPVTRNSKPETNLKSSIANRKFHMSSKPTLIVLGTGFGGFSLLKHLRRDLFKVVVVSPRNHFLFTPLLPSTTVGTVEFRSIIESVRVARPDAQYLQAFATSLDPGKRILQCKGALDAKKFSLSYDYLVIAVGASPATYNIKGVKEHAFFLKDIGDARAIRQRIIDCLELASQPGVSAAERARLLHYVVVGGGPTGVEFAAEMHDLITEDLRRLYPLLVKEVRITLLEAGEQILNSFDAVLSRYTTGFFRRQRIDVRTNSKVVQVKKASLQLSDKSVISYGLLVWTTGIAPTPFVSSLKLPKDKQSRLIVDDRLRVKETPQHFALGDCISIEEKEIPATAQVAQQEGTYLAGSLERLMRGLPLRPFEYKHYGMLAYIGSAHALADLATVKGKGFTAWLFWRSVYVTRLVSIKNKVLVLFDWAKTFVFGRDISRF